MPVYSNDHCPHCGSTIETMRRLGDVIGNPFVNCPSCSKEIFRSHVKEWDEFSFAKKIFVVVIFSVYTAAWAVIAFIATALVLTALGFNRELTALIFVVPVSLVLLRYGLLVARVLGSKKRTSNHSYRASLAQKRL